MKSPEFGELNKPREECGVFGIYAPNPAYNVAELTYCALHTLQHRGQSAAGIAVVEANKVKDEHNIIGVKGVGLLPQALHNGMDIRGLPSESFASGHVRYSTMATDNKQKEIDAAQPMLGGPDKNRFALSHNGHIVNFDELRSGLQHPEQFVTDSQLMTRLIDQKIESGVSLKDSITATALELNGAFSLIIMGQDKLYGMRDPNGLRPLMLGQIDGGWTLASEIAALDIVKAQFVREVNPGELIEIDSDGIRSYNPFPASAIDQKTCAFEYVYFSRPDNEISGENIELARRRMGQELAREYPVDVDIIIGSPNSGLSAAYGYASETGKPVEHGLVKSPYIGRSFIESVQSDRERAVRLKFNANRDIVRGQRLVLVDDSIIRSTTTRVIVEMLREAGAKEVHLRISSPPYRWPCFYGMDTGNRKELIAACKSIEEIRQEIGADSLGYLSVEGLRQAIGPEAGKLCCYACMTGKYPTKVSESQINQGLPTINHP